MLTRGRKRCGKNIVTTASEVCVRDARLEAPWAPLGAPWWDRRRQAPRDHGEAGEAGITALEPSPLKVSQRNWPWEGSSETRRGLSNWGRLRSEGNGVSRWGRDPKKGITWSWGFKWMGHWGRLLRRAASSSLHSSLRLTCCACWPCFLLLLLSPAIPAQGCSPPDRDKPSNWILPALLTRGQRPGAGQIYQKSSRSGQSSPLSVWHVN